MTVGHNPTRPFMPSLYETLASVLNPRTSTPVRYQLLIQWPEELKIPGNFTIETYPSKSVAEAAASHLREHGVRDVDGAETRPLSVLVEPYNP